MHAPGRVSRSKQGHDNEMPPCAGKGVYGSGEITILTPYMGQLLLLRRKLSQHVLTFLVGPVAGFHACKSRSIACTRCTRLAAGNTSVLARAYICSTA